VRLRIAIVGCGQIADAHIQEVRRIPGATVEAVCDVNHHMAEQAAARFQISRLYTDLERMLDDVRPDVVHVTTPPRSHLPIVRVLAGRGVHAYIEKPFTATLAEAEELADCVTRAGVLACVGHCNAYDSSYLRLRRLADEGRLGDVVHVDTVMGYDLAGPFGAVMMGDPTHWVHDLPGGIAQNNISHPLSLLLPFLPDENPVVSALGLRCRPARYGDARDRLFDEIRVTLIGSRVTASIQFSCRVKPLQVYATVHGTKAYATASLDSRTLRVVNGASMPGPFARVQWAYREKREAAREFRRTLAAMARAELHFFEGMHELIRRFYLTIEGKAEMPIPMGEALRATRIIEEIFTQCARRAEGP
jgi:predicted dehydrogenase